MSDAVIATIARRVAVAAAINGYERKDKNQQEFLIALAELCKAVKDERNENEQRAGN
jgi:hypothetical protein